MKTNFHLQRRRWVILSIFLTLMLWNSKAYPQITIDGNPNDWPAIFASGSTIPVKSFVKDPVNSSSDNIFTQGTSASAILPDKWFWTTNGANDKNDMNNVGCALIGTKLYFFADRHANNGDAAIGIWVFKSGVSTNPDGSFSGTHTDGDLLITTHFINGGSVDDRHVYIWSGGTLVEQIGTSIDISVQVNTSEVQAPVSWAYTPKFGTAGYYPTNSFIEGYIDLATIGIDACFTTFLMETAQSQSLSSSYEDLALGSFNTRPSVSINNQTVCAGSSATFTAIASGGVGNYEYSWDGGSYTSSSTFIINPATTSGSVTIKVRGENNCESPLVTGILTVNPTPDLVVKTLAAVCAPNTVDLTSAVDMVNSKLEGGTLYYFMPDGTTAVANPTTVSASGTYYIEVRTSAGCSDREQVVITVNPKPDLVVKTLAAVCAPNTVDLTSAVDMVNSKLEGGTLYYFMPDGTTAVTNPSAVSASGTYYMEVRTSAGCSDREQVVITVNPKPDLVVKTLAAVCAPNTVDLTSAVDMVNSKLEGGTLYYFMPDGTTAVTNPSAVSASGTYYIEVRTSAGCSDREQVTITVNPKPDLVVKALAAVCAPNTVDLTSAVDMVNSKLEGGTLYYFMPDGTTAVTNPSAISASGTYYIEVLTSAGCSDREQVIITVNPKPDLVVKTLAAVCAPNTVDLTSAVDMVNSKLEGGTLYYFMPDGTTAVANPTTVSASGTYYIEVRTSAGCSDREQVTITVNPKPDLVVKALAAVCAPNTVDLTSAVDMVNSKLEGGTLYYFTPDGTTVVANPSAVSASGTYYIEVRTSAGCSDREQVVITVNPKPDLVVKTLAAVCAPNTVDLTSAVDMVNSKLEGGTLYYFMPDGTTAVTNPSAVSDSGTYYIEVRTSAGCSDREQVVITVNPKPDLVVKTLAAVCAPNTVDLTSAVDMVNSKLEGGTLYYFMPDGTTAVANPSAVSASGTYYIEVRTSAGCSDREQVTITVNPKPDLVVKTLAAVCAPNNVDLTSAVDMVNSKLEGGTLYYFMPDGTTAATNPSAVNASGTYYIEVRTSAGCSDREQVTITVNPKPDLVVKTLAAVCAPNTVDLTSAVDMVNSKLEGGTLYYFMPDGTTAVTNPTIVSASGTYYIEVRTSAGCSDREEVSITIENCVTSYCTRTQGFFGNEGGKYCDGRTTRELLNTLLTTDLVIGTPGHSFTIPAGSVDCVLGLLPGGGTPAVIPNGDWSCSNTGRLVKGKQGTLDNVLLSQTITLGLNLRLDPNLGAVELHSQYFYTRGASGCIVSSSDYPLGDMVQYTLPTSVWNYITNIGSTPTIRSIYDLANKLLGGDKTTSVSLSDINKAVSMFNEAADECQYMFFPSETRSAMSNSEAPGIIATESGNLTVQVVPNPFRTSTEILVTSPVNSNKVKVEIYDLTGRLVTSYTSENIEAGVVKSFLILDSDLIANQSIFICVVRTDLGTVTKQIIRQF